MGEFNEYVFCPYCGGITAPGTCVNCGMPTNGQAQSQNKPQEMTNAKPEQGYEQYQPQNQAASQGYEKYQPQGGQTEQGQVVNQSQEQQIAQGYEKYQPQGGQTTQGYEAYQPRKQQESQGYAYQPQQGVQGYGQYQQQLGTAGYGGSPVNHSAQSLNYTSNGANDSMQQTDMSYGYEPPKKKSHWWIWLLIIGFAFFFIALVVVIAILASVFFFGSSTISTTSTTQTISQYTPQVTVPEVSEDYGYETTDLFVNARELGRMDFSNFDWESYADAAMVYSDTDDGSNDYFLNKDYQSSFGSNHDNHTLSEFTGQYYEPFVDCIDTSYDYGLSRHFISYSNVIDNVIVNADIAYIQLEGDTVPNEDEINRQILEMTANDFWGYLDGQTSLSYTPSEVYFIVDSFIPYNDGEKMSVLLDANIYLDGYQNEHYIYGINIDLVNGEIMDNASILEIDEDFAAMFRERNDAQNGTDVVGVVNCTDEELADLLANPDTNIIFYTPYGMEVGMNYMADGYSWGWVSITLSDYEDYLQ